VSSAAHGTSTSAIVDMGWDEILNMAIVLKVVDRGELVSLAISHRDNYMMNAVNWCP
jgi:hypothetical protein